MLIQILLAGGDLDFAGLILLRRDHTVLIAQFQLGFLLGQLGFAGVQLGLTGIQLLLSRIQLRPPFIQFLLSRFQNAESLFQLPLGVLDLHIGIVQFLLSVGDLYLGIGDLLQPVRIFQLAVLQFFQSVSQLLLALGSLVSKLLFGFVQLLLGIPAESVGADVLLGFGQSLHRLLYGGNQIVISLGEGLGLVSALHHGINVGVIIGVDHIILHIDDDANRAVAQRGAAPLHHGNIGAAGSNAHNGELLLGKGLLRGFIILGIVILRRQQGQHLTDAQRALIDFFALFDDTFIGRLGPTALGQFAAVHKGAILSFPVCDGMEAAHQRVAGSQRQLPIQRFGCHDGLHAIHSGDGLQIGFLQTQIACDAQVVQVGFAIQLAHRMAHIGGGGQQTGQKARAQCHDEKNRQKPAEAAPNRAETLLEKRTLYHSINSTGVGEGLTSLPTIWPLFTRMTRSAMAVRAVLWVMTMTVFPVVRQVSCSSLRILLPVT